MIIFLVGFSVFMYLDINPLKSCLFLISFLIFYLVFLSLGKTIWFSYFICLIFVSGILAILVYFTSLSSLNLKFMNLNLGLLIFIIFFLYLGFFFSLKFLNLNFLYLNFYLILFIWILGILVVFFNFVSYMISFLSGLRKF